MNNTTTKLGLGLGWWQISDRVRVTKKKQFSNPIVITINGANRQESRLIKEWCNQNNALIKSTTYFDDNLSYTRIDGTKHDFRFINNERIVIAEPDTIQNLENWLSTFPKRQFAVLLEDIEYDTIKNMLKGHNNTRIVSDIYCQNTYIVSFDDADLRVELVLKGS